MIYSEAAYFDGVHVQHCADRDEHFRIKRKEKEREKAARYMPRRRFVRDELFLVP